MTLQECDWSRVVAETLDAHGLNHRELAELLGVARSTIQAWSSGARAEPSGWPCVRLYLMWENRPRKRKR